MENPLRRPEVPNSRGPPSRHNSRGHASRDPYSRSRPSPHDDLEYQRRRPGNAADEPQSFSLIVQGHLIAMSGEFIGTIMFLFFAFGGTQIANTLTPADSPSLTQLSYISLSFGIALAVTAWTFYRVSGGLFNPAVCTHPSLCLYPIALTHCEAPLGHFWLGPRWGIAVGSRHLSLSGPDNWGNSSGCSCLGLISWSFAGWNKSWAWNFHRSRRIHWNVSDRRAGTHNSIPGSRKDQSNLHCSRGYWAGTVRCWTHWFVSRFEVRFLKSTVLTARFLGVYFTGGSLNPARSFGPCVINRDFPTYHWIYWIGPFLGAFLAAGYYQLAKFFNYEVANPGQDASNPEESKNRWAVFLIFGRLMKQHAINIFVVMDSRRDDNAHTSHFPIT